MLIVPFIPRPVIFPPHLLRGGGGPMPTLWELAAMTAAIVVGLWIVSVPMMWLLERSVGDQRTLRRFVCDHFAFLWGCVRAIW